MNTLRVAMLGELSELSDLCLRSKAHWGYDDDFMEKCRSELTITKGELQSDPICVAVLDGTVVGVAHLIMDFQHCELDKLFVDPSYFGKGVGTKLFDWAVAEARNLGANRMTIDSEPKAAAFYQKMGAEVVGERPSGSIPGRVLPQLLLNL